MSDHPTPPRAGSWPRPQATPRIESLLRIESDGTVVALSGKVEYGQGIRTGFRRIVAETLDLPLDQVRVVLGETASTPWDMGTFGSMSTMTDGRALRAAAWFARQQLLVRAAARFGVAIEALSFGAGQVFAPDGRAVSFAELVRDQPLAGDLPEAPPRAAPPATDSPMRQEAMDIVTGRAKYAIDVRLPGMLHGSILHPPTLGARLESLDPAAAEKVRGVVQVVRDGDFVGVVAERALLARTAAALLKATWTAGAPRSGGQDIVLESDPEAEEAFRGAARVLKAEYFVPHVSNASLGPSAGTADVRPDGADLYTATQRPFPLRDEVAQTLGVPKEKVRVWPQLVGGSYGKNGAHDAALAAVRLSKAVGRPVQVAWSRAEEFRANTHRPELRGELEAGLDGDGRLSAWRYHSWTNPHTYGEAGRMPERLIVATSGRGAVPEYRLGKADIQLHLRPGKVRTGALRSLAAAPNTFAIESFIDELAEAAGTDPIDFRLAHLDDERLRGVLRAARELSGWDARPPEPGRALGVACAAYHGTYVAEVVEARARAGGRVRVGRVWCAVDAGHLVHPDGARNQVEGAVTQALSWALFESLAHEDGRVLASSFADYPIATARDAPEAIEVTFIGRDEVPPTGVGEPGAVPFAAALANAVYRACGVRVRELPLRT